MIDHIFTSLGISPAGRTTFWNTDHPELRADPSLKDAFEDASDHFPVTLDIDWP
jgi:endonuclease/exonuclease/phosphatase family metal-dependent hydrolase